MPILNQRPRKATITNHKKVWSRVPQKSAACWLFKLTFVGCSRRPHQKLVGGATKVSFGLTFQDKKLVGGRQKSVPRAVGPLNGFSRPEPTHAGSLQTFLSWKVRPKLTFVEPPTNFWCGRREHPTKVSLKGQQAADFCGTLCQTQDYTTKTKHF